MDLTEILTGVMTKVGKPKRSSSFNSKHQRCFVTVLEGTTKDVGAPLTPCELGSALALRDAEQDKQV